MIALKKDFAHGFVHVKVTSQDDLWYLEQIIEPDDSLRMKTERKIKLGGADQNTKVIKKTITLNIKAETIELSEDMDVLRVKGTTLDEHDDIPKGSYHSFSIRVDDDFSVTKSSWTNFMKKRLEEALNATTEKVYVVLYDNEKLIIARTQQSGITVVSEVSGSSHKKLYEHNADSIFDLVNKELDTLHLTKERIVFASPGFWHKSLQQVLKEEYKKLGVFIDYHDITIKSITKLLRRPEVENIFAKQRLTHETVFVEDALRALEKEELAYGAKDIETAAQSGAVKQLGVTKNYLQKAKQEERYPQVQSLLHAVEQTNGNILFLYDEDSQKQIDALGGIVGILRWKVS
jgi:mRNA surveillance protein pelota